MTRTALCGMHSPATNKSTSFSSSEPCYSER
nr:MAG TPA: hypothetical protein [Caudoviricetes sp.]